MWWLRLRIAAFLQYFGICCFLLCFFANFAFRREIFQHVIHEEENDSCLIALRA